MIAYYTDQIDEIVAAAVMPLRKRCPRCKTEKDINDFALYRGKWDGHAGWCKDCFRPYARTYREARLAHYQATNRAWNYRNNQARMRAGLTRKEWAALPKYERSRLVKEIPKTEVA